jgi:hypothetical protein
MNLDHRAKRRFIEHGTPPDFGDHSLVPCLAADLFKSSAVGGLDRDTLLFGPVDDRSNARIGGLVLGKNLEYCLAVSRYQVLDGAKSRYVPGSAHFLRFLARGTRSRRCVPSGAS